MLFIVYCITLPNIAYMSGWISATKGRCGGCFPSFIFSVKNTGPRASTSTAPAPPRSKLANSTP